MNKREIKKFLGLTQVEFNEFETSVNGIDGRHSSIIVGTVFPSLQEVAILKLQQINGNYYDYKYFLSNREEVFPNYHNRRNFLRKDNCIVLEQLDNECCYVVNHKVYMLQSWYDTFVGIDAATNRHCLKEALVEVDGVLINRCHINTDDKYVFKKDGVWHLCRNYIEVVSDYNLDVKRYATKDYFTQEEVNRLVEDGQVVLTSDGFYELASSVKEYNGVIYSSKAYDEEFFICPVCHQPHPRSEGYIVENKETHTQDILCQGCIEAKCISIDDVYYYKSQIVYMDGHLYTDNEMSYEILNYHRFNRNNYVPLHLEDENTEMYFGTEVETQGPDRNAAFVLRGNCKDIFHLERDGSIGQGFEIISMPMSLNYIYSRAEDIRQMFADLYAHGQKGHNATNACCGFHIHVSRKAFKNEDAIMKANALINQFQHENEKLARRKNSHYYSYNMVNGIVTKQKVQLNCGHCYAVNNSNANTVEFRIFRSTLNLETYIGTIEFVKNIVDAANGDKLRFKYSDLLKGNYLPLYVADLNRRRENQLFEVINFDAVCDLQAWNSNELLQTLIKKKKLKQQIAEFNASYPQYRIGGAY